MNAPRHSGEYGQFCGFKLPTNGWYDRQETNRERGEINEDPPWEPENSVTLVALDARLRAIDAAYHSWEI
jgi:hypothetical protein